MSLCRPLTSHVSSYPQHLTAAKVLLVVVVVLVLGASWQASAHCAAPLRHTHSASQTRDTCTIAIKRTTSPTIRASRHDARKYNTLLLTDNRLAQYARPSTPPTHTRTQCACQRRWWSLVFEAWCAWEWCSLVSCSPARQQAERCRSHSDKHA